MLKLHRISTSIFCLAAFSATCFAQTPATSSAPVAYVYVGASKGVYLYNSAANGSLTLVSGSPFSVAGSVVGSNGKYFVSLGTSYMHSYSLASNGGIKSQVSQIDTLTQSGSGCGVTAGALFDHIGQDIYAMIGNIGSEGCGASIQSYKISSAGALSFIASTAYNYYGADTLPAITGNDDFAYNGSYVGDCTENTNVFERQGDGALQSIGVAAPDGSGATMNLPAPQPGWVGFNVLPYQAADPTDHLIIPLQDIGGDGYCGSPVQPVQLASYTVDSKGDLTTTDTWQTMSTPNVFPTVMNMSPSGEFLAIGGDPNPNINGSTAPQTAGLQVYLFNGTNSIAPLSGTLTTSPIDEIHWDNNNHLYAVSNSAGKLYVYNVTSTSVTATPGSPYSISKPNALVVVPTLSSCMAPTSDGVNLCSPASGSTVSSPVTVEAAATVSGTLSSVQLWIDGVKKYSTSSKTLNTSIRLSVGTHRFAVLAVNTADEKWETAVDATVK